MHLCGGGSDGAGSLYRGKREEETGLFLSSPHGCEKIGQTALGKTSDITASGSASTLPAKHAYAVGLVHMPSVEDGEIFQCIMTDAQGHAIIRGVKYRGETKMGFLDRLFGKKQKNYQPLVIYGLCGPIGVGAHKSGEAFYWTASVILQAWKEEGSDELHTEKIHLEKECDEEGVRALQQQLSGHTIFHARVRRGEGGFELLELLEAPCEEAQLQQLVPEQPKRNEQEPSAQPAGTLTFGKEEIELNTDSEEAMHLFYKLKKRQAGWRSDAVKLVTDTFVPAYNEAKEKGKKLTKKEVREQILLHAITLSEDGSDAFTFHFTFEKEGEKMQLDVSGSVSKGMIDCQWNIEQ